jgi:anti-sigma factor RsiW
MKLTKAQLKAIWQEQTARATPRRAECLSEEQFVRAVTGEMGQQERAQMARHLAACSDCVEEYRIPRSLRPLAEQAEAILAAFTAPEALRSDRICVRLKERTGDRRQFA